MSHDPRRGIAWALAAAVASGIFVIPWKLANAAGDPSAAAFALLASAALFNTALWLGPGRRGPGVPLGRYELWIAVAMGALSLFGNLASARAISLLSASLTNALQRGEVLVVALLAWALLGERVERRFWLGAAIAGLGIVVLRDPLADAGANDAIDPVGGLYAGLSVLCFSAMAVVSRMAIHRVDPVRLNAIRLWLSLPMWLVVSGGLGALGTLQPAQVGYAALAALAGPFAARLFLLFSARHVDARITTLGALSAPVISVTLEWLLLGRVPPSHELWGGAILLAGIAVPLARRRLPAPDAAS